ncbi:hypothetical protein ACFSHP_25920 [Novosphingobium panipatense]
MLVAHPDMLAWWVPAEVRPAHFALSDPPADLHALAARTTLPVPYPPHLLIATRHGLGVYALPANERPGAETPVLHSPILNVFADGRLCWGNIPKPRALSIASIPAYESALFDSGRRIPIPGRTGRYAGRAGWCGSGTIWRRAARAVSGEPSQAFRRRHGRAGEASEGPPPAR